MARVTKRRILFVDDEQNFLEGVRLMLRGQRDVWDLSFAKSADEALEQAAETRFHAIVSDVTMPLKSGLDFLEELRASGNGKNTPVIMLTGNAESDLKRKALDLGAADLLNKPVAAEDLLARLRSVLRLQSYEEQLRTQNEKLEQKVLERTRDLDYSRLDILWRLAKAGEYRDEETGYHVIRVACCSRVLAKADGLPPEEVRAIFLTSPLHDVGKIGVPDGILLKKGSLSAEERTIMEKHCEIGASILLEEPRGMQELFDDSPAIEVSEVPSSPADNLRDAAAAIILSHHEKWDGSGYPNRLAEEKIPVGGRIVAICDVYDALRAERPYKEAFSVEKTLGIMQDGAGSHFDPNLFEVFETVASEFEEIRARYAL